MSFVKVLQRVDVKAGQRADPGRPDDPKLLRPTKVTVVSFGGTVGPEGSLTLTVKMRKNKSSATLIEVGPDGMRGLELKDALAVQKPGPPGGGGGGGGGGRP